MISIDENFEKSKNIKNQIQRKLFFQNEILAKSQINLNKENCSKLSNTNMEKNYYSLCQDSFQKKPNQNQRFEKNKHQCIKNNCISSPNKNLAKTRRCKSTKRNMLTCQQILQMGNKRQTYSALSMEHNSSRQTVSRISKKDGNTKKMKIKKKQDKNQRQTTLRNQNNQRNQRKKNQEKKAYEVPIEYPESYSNSYIIFSEKDTTLSNAGLANKVLVQSKQIIFKKNPILSLSNLTSHNKKQKSIIKSQNNDKKRNWAAIVIQKNWRGYQTRQLLQEYIVDEQQKLRQALSTYKLVKQPCFEANLKLRNNKQQLFNDQSEIKQNSMKGLIQFLEIENSLDRQSLTKFSSKSLNQGMIMNQEFSASHSSFIDQGIQFSYDAQEKQLYPLQQEDDKQFCRKAPIIMSNTSEILQIFKQKQMIAEQNADLVPEQHRKEKKQIPIHQNQPFQQGFKLIKLSHQNQRQQNSQKDSKQIKSNLKKDNYQIKNWKQLFTILEEYTISQFNNLIIKAKQKLTNKMKQNNIQFVEMLKIRENLHAYPQQIDDLLKQTKSIISGMYDSIQKLVEGAEDMKKTTKLETQQLGIFKQLKKQLLKKINPNINLSNEHLRIRQELYEEFSDENYGLSQECNKQDLIHQYTQLKETQKINGLRQIAKQYFKKDGEIEDPKSPLCEYYTIQMPTQQLSPYKVPSNSSALESLRIYLENIYAEYKQQNQVIDRQEQLSQTTYLCQLLRKHSEVGAQNMIQRCFIQVLVDILAGQYKLQDILWVSRNWDGSYEKDTKNMEGDHQNLLELIKNWTKQVDKWELCSIEEVSRNMEQSCEVSASVTISNSPIIKKDSLK